jgi:hypothetical protein
MRLGRLTWSETWRWIRRNLPGLLRYGEEYLGRLWPRLGAELERWEELERRILAAGPDAPPITSIVDEIVPRRGSTRRPGGIQRFDPRPRGQRPLRVAVAGPFLAGPELLARAVSRLAANHGIGGRAMAGQGDESGSLAVLIDVPTPFRDGATASEGKLLDWIRQVSDRHPDVILLDFGYPVPLPVPGPDAPWRRVLRGLRHEVLVIAAGGNRVTTDDRPQPATTVTAPGAYEEVLAIGALNADGTLPPYAEWTPAIAKPDLFMIDQLLGTPLEEALVSGAFQPAARGTAPAGLGPGTHGSSFAALHAVAAAILVWATLPDIRPRGVRAVLRAASRPVKGHAEPTPLALDLTDAVAEARRQLIRHTLREGPCSLQALAAITGLDLRLVIDSIGRLLKQEPPEVRRFPRGRLERYGLMKG